MRLTLFTVVLLGSLTACSAIKPTDSASSPPQQQPAIAQNFVPRGDEAKQASDVPSLNLFGGSPMPAAKTKAQTVQEPQATETDDPYICIGLGCSCSVE